MRALLAEGNQHVIVGADEHAPVRFFRVDECQRSADRDVGKRRDPLQPRQSAPASQPVLRADQN
jgi:hypothetical protein